MGGWVGEWVGVWVGVGGCDQMIPEAKQLL